MPLENLRRHPRQLTKLPARLHLAWGVLDGTIENIGEGGTFFVTDTLEGVVIEGDHLEVRFEGPDGPVGLPSSVLRVERYFHDGDLFRAFAIRFDQPHTGGVTEDPSS